MFIRLRDRVAFARDKGAALFISLHADTIRNRNVRGLSVYTLSERASDKEAAELAERENKADLIAGIDLSGQAPGVTDILIDLAQRESMNESARAAGFLVRELKRVSKLLRNTHRFAGFAVLKAPDVPSLLIEMGFLSNARDERSLRSAKFRRRLAGAVTKAIDSFFARVEQADRQ
jgi:N-acetylmuramoyl-L-alanine amidase